MIAYKVVNKDLKSCVMSLFASGANYTIQYKLNEWVETYYACCFKKLKDAKEFTRRQGFEDLIFKCEIEQAKLYKIFILVIDCIPYKGTTSDESELYWWPEGTIFASKVKLLEKVS